MLTGIPKKVGFKWISSDAPGNKKAAEPSGYAAFRTYLDLLGMLLGAQEGTRTPTVLPPPGPEPGASTNFATWAFPEKAEF